MSEEGGSDILVVVDKQPRSHFRSKQPPAEMLRAGSTMGGRRGGDEEDGASGRVGGDKESAPQQCNNS